MIFQWIFNVLFYRFDPNFADFVLNGNTQFNHAQFYETSQLIANGSSASSSSPVEYKVEGNDNADVGFSSYLSFENVASTSSPPSIYCPVSITWL